MLLSRCATILSIASVLGSADLRNTDNTSTRKVPNRTRLARNIIRGNNITRTKLPITKKPHKVSVVKKYRCHADATGTGYNCTVRGCYNGCNCNPGFDGNGLSCDDIDECESYFDHDCHNSPPWPYEESCVNTRGSYKCETLMDDDWVRVAIMWLLFSIPPRFLLILPKWFRLVKNYWNFSALLQLASGGNDVIVVNALVEEPPALREGLEVEVDGEQGTVTMTIATGDDTEVKFRRAFCCCNQIPDTRFVSNSELAIPIQFKFWGQNVCGRFCVTGTRFIGYDHLHRDFLQGQNQHMAHPYRREWCRLIWRSSFDLIDQGAMLLPPKKIFQKSSRVVPVVEKSPDDPVVASSSEAADSNVVALINFFANYPGLKVTIGGALALSYRAPLVMPVAYMKHTPSTCGLVACLDPEERKKEATEAMQGNWAFAILFIFWGSPSVIAPYIVVFLLIISSLWVSSAQDILHFLSMTVLPEACVWLIWCFVWEKFRAPYCRCAKCPYSFFYSEYLPRKWTTIEHGHAAGGGGGGAGCHSVRHFNRRLEHI